MGGVSGNGLLAIGSNATLEALQGVSVASIAFGGLPGERLLLDQPQYVGATISGFGAADAIDMVGRTVTAIAFDTVSQQLTIQGAAGAIASLRFAGSYSGGAFGFGGDGHGGSVIFLT